MPTVPPRMRSASALLALLLLGPRPALADRPTSSLVNVPVCTAAGDQVGPVTTSDGAGGAILTWGDARAGGTNSDVYVQHVRATGVVDPSWAVNGQAICTATGNQFNPRVVSDGAGGAVLTWQDFRNGTTCDVYAQHVSASGAVDSAWPANGRAICTSAGNQNSIVIVSDDAGGAIIAWRDFRAGSTSDLYAGHVLANGQVDPVWPADGRALSTQPDTAAHPSPPAAISDGGGGAIVAWADFRNGNSDIYAQHVRANGMLDPTWPVDGRALCTALGDQRRPDIVNDNAGGALVGWDDLRGGTTSDIYAQHVRVTGAVDPAWPMDGQLGCAASGNQSFVRMVPDGSGGALISWLDNRAVSTGQDLYAQHMRANGSVDPGWPADGLAVCTAFGNQTNPAVAADGTAGVLVTWQDPRTGGPFDIYLEHVLASGALDAAWPLDGRAVCTAAQSQQLPAILADGSGGAIVAWYDARSATGFNDIYAQRVQANGQLGGSVVGVPHENSLAFALEGVHPNPWQGGALTVNLSLASDANATLEVIDITGRRVAAHELEAPGLGRQSVTMGFGQQLAAGVYLIRLRQGAAVNTRRFAALK